ncbi:MAG: dephospho-CoA kinase [Gallionellales bacterium 35-53-114]|jgi:dephospho-CoA kinase|nr:MAG: dephospho-CoA kinase [Gallionellales bacterium 35-53-114]OYZ63897.1 MAG: dephospho-CoA kinase [Gallionellales bacterium 24-53-125]OZB09272.1 MAG: dephospho-CoA kinase [Gallionellales bacterium 39-52-133]HQS59119.1 dephospho-CoA kinase [Gallionellaceae bacterium]HQS75855.1 dephospho-CoA kinase [Gallionellaceae bacterium]
MTYFVGLTGGIGSGKSTVATLFAELGVPVIDTDAISHQLTKPVGAAIGAIRNTFGDNYIDASGALDRAKMRQLVFTDANARLLLEKILHPLILAQARTQAEAISAPYVILVIPLLFETADYQGWLNRTLTVDCAEETQIARVLSRSGLSEQTVRAIMSRQLSREQRLKLADDAIRNDDSLIELRREVFELNQRYLSLAKISN